MASLSRNASNLLFTASNLEKFGLCLLSDQLIRMWSTVARSCSWVYQSPKISLHFYSLVCSSMFFKRKLIFYYLTSSEYPVATIATKRQPLPSKLGANVCEAEARSIKSARYREQTTVWFSTCNIYWMSLMYETDGGEYRSKLRMLRICFSIWTTSCGVYSSAVM